MTPPAPPLEPHPDFASPRPEGPLCLVILDGVGLGPRDAGNAWHLAETPFLDRLMEAPLRGRLRAHGRAVGMPSDGDMGNSEVGHNAIGAGRVFDQGAKLVGQAIETGSLFQGETWSWLMEACQAGGTLHLIGLWSDGNVHSHIDHVDALVEAALGQGAKVRMHPLLGDYVSREFYEVHEDGAIESPRADSEFTHDLPGYIKRGQPCAAAWLDVPNERGREVRGISKSRPVEARVIAKEVRRLIDHDSTLTFGVISFYSAQVDEIGLAMIETGLTEPANNARGWQIAEEWATTYNAEGRKVERLRIGTVDAFQGKEFDVVFLSVTRSNDLPGETDEQQRRKYGHLMLENRLCVAMSRQQRLLIAVGDLAFVKADEAAKPLRPLRAFTVLCGGPNGVVR